MSTVGFRDLPLEIFSGRVTYAPPGDLPPGGSPANNDVAYEMGGWRSRPGIGAGAYPAIAGDPAVNGVGEYITPAATKRVLVLDANGNFYKETAPGTLTLVASNAEFATSFMQSATAFGRHYCAFSQGGLGFDIPRAYDDTYFDRVSQGGPGAPPVCANFLPSAATVQGAGAGGALTVANAPNGAITTDPIVVTIPAYPPYYPGGVGYYFTTATYVTTAPHGLAVGQLVTITAVTNALFDAANAPVYQIVSTTSFKILLTSSVYAASGTGSVTPQAPSIVRASNTATATTTAAHGFQPGWLVQIGGFTPTAVGGAATAVQQNGTVTVTTATAHGLVPGSIAIIASMSDATFDGTFTVLTAPTPTTFTYAQQTSTGSANGGTVSSPWNGTFLIASVPTPTSFTYANTGPNLSIGAAGTATITGRVTAGTHLIAVIFVTRQGYRTKPSPFATFNANGGELLQLTQIPTGPSNIVARIICATAANLANFFIIPQQFAAGQSTFINDNVTTSAVIDFDDTTLLSAENVDEYYNKIVLQECAAFVPYSGRLFAFGAKNIVPNFLNLSFDGGWEYPSNSAGPNLAGSGTDGGGGSPWTNPNNITSTVAFATITLTAGLHQFQISSDPLLAETFGFAEAVGAPILGVQVSIAAKLTGASANGTLLLQLLKAGVPVGNPKSVSIPNDGTLRTYVFGSASDAWGASLLGGDVNAATFGVSITGIGGHGFNNTFSVDNGNITVNALGSAVPLGWTLDAANGVDNGNAIGGGEWLDAYVITGDGATAVIGMIEQSASQDFLGEVILSPNTQYSVRVTAKIAGGITGAQALVVDLYSPSLGLLASASFAGNLFNSTAFSQQTLAFNAPLPALVPTDLILRLYANGTPALGAQFIIDRIAPFPTAQPYNTTQAYGSLALDPESFDGVTGIIQANPGDGEALTTGFRIRDRLYIVRTFSLYGTKDPGSGNEPATWKADEVSNKSGTPCPRGVATGEGWAVIAARDNVYVFSGASPVPISPEIQPDWAQINWNAASTMWVVVDTEKRRILIGAPVNGATQPNRIYYLDFSGVRTLAELESYYTVRFSQYSGKILAIGDAPKWSIWNISANSGALVEQSDGGQHVFLGNGLGTGKVYDLDGASFNGYEDDGLGIPWSYATYYAPGHQEEEMMELGSGNKRHGYLSGFVEGSGQMDITAQPLGNISSTLVGSLQLAQQTAPVNLTSVTRLNGIVTVVTAAPHGLATTDTQVVLAGVTDPSYNGTWPIQKIVNGNVFLLYIAGANSTSSAGTMQRLLRDFELTINVFGARISYIFSNHGGVEGIGNWARMSKFIPRMRPDVAAPVTGMAA